MTRTFRSFHGVPHRGATRKAAGFTLLEVLVAMTILAIIIIMCAMVFQQSSLAWQSGMRRAEGNMTLRSLVGFMENEMSHAVDARAFGLENIFSDKEAVFVVLSGDAVDDQERTPRMIRYSESNGIIQRQEFLVHVRDGVWVAEDPFEIDLNEAMPLEKFEMQPEWADSTDELPQHVTIRASISQEGDVSSVGVWSLGPVGEDTVGDTAEIRSW